MSYPRGLPDGMERFAESISDIRRQLRDLQRPSGTAIGSLVDQVQARLAQLDATVSTLVSAAIAANSYTKTQIDNKVANPPAGSAVTGNISATGTITTPSTVQADAGVNSVGAYGNNITAARLGAWWRSNGDAGVATSSIRFKTHLEPAGIDPLAILQITSTLYDYKAECDIRDNPDNPEYNPKYHVQREWGAIAEQLHELGLWQVVAYEDHETPFSIHYEMLGLLAIEAAKFIWAEHLKLEARVAALEDERPLSARTN